MDQGSMRADVNVSVRRPGDEFGTRTETKNVNSVRFVMAVVESEAKRQVALIEDGGKVVQETRSMTRTAMKRGHAQQGRRA
jgi:aspartyl-tRNA(Asn)/glutamyl-tRNA(Gln) amidotransferase subunit B